MVHPNFLVTVLIFVTVINAKDVSRSLQGSKPKERLCGNDYNDILQVEPLEIDNWGTLTCPANFRRNIQDSNARCFLTGCGSTVEKDCSDTLQGLLNSILSVYYNVDASTLLHTAFPQADPTFNFGIIDGDHTEALNIVGNYILSINVRTSVNLAYAALWYRFLKDLNPTSNEDFRLELLIIAFFLFTCSDQNF
ncbi:hypothetical protein ABG067_006346 [Albugo candida]